ncbi:MAG TPA: hypothetical protein VHD38_00165, partial [Candidatus Paceibacterota bacterium]|nr:hypothetical protein [Candidatus Paceibacterota bacterium]
HIALTAKSPYDGTQTTLDLIVMPQAVVAYQALQAGQNGSYVALSTRAPASLSEIQPGTRAAVYILRDERDRLSTNYILFGNPL